VSGEKISVWMVGVDGLEFIIFQIQKYKGERFQYEGHFLRNSESEIAIITLLQVDTFLSFFIIIVRSVKLN